MSSQPRGILLYGMYDTTDVDSAPKVRITMMAAALGRRLPVDVITGDRVGRGVAGIRWLLTGGWRRVDAAYVEASTAPATPIDLVLLAILRALGRPVGVYFRDAYQLHRDLFPVSRPRQRLGDLIWRLTQPVLQRTASRRFVPTAGLAAVLGIEDAVLLPPGTDPSLPFLGAGAEPLVAAILAPAATAAGDLLRRAMERVRVIHPDIRLRVISRGPPGDEAPDWIEYVPGDRAAIPDLLRPAQVCVIPLPLTRYTELALPVRLTEYLSLGVAIVSTDSRETRTYLGASDAALLVADAPEPMAEAIVRVIADSAFRDGLARRARAFAEVPEHTWDARAMTVLEALGLFTTPRR